MSIISIQCKDISTSNCDVIVCPGYEIIAKLSGLNYQVMSKVDPLIISTYRKLFEPVRNGTFVTLPGSAIAKAILYTSEVPCLIEPDEMIKNLYRQIMEYAVSHNHHSLALPLIGVESYNYDLTKGWHIALEETYKFISTNKDYDLDIQFYTYEPVTEIIGKKIANELGIKEIRKRTGLKATSKIRLTINEGDDEKIITITDKGKICYKRYIGQLIDSLRTMNIDPFNTQRLLKWAENWADEHLDEIDTVNSNYLEIIDNDLNCERYPLDTNCELITSFIQSFH